MFENAKRELWGSTPEEMTEIFKSYDIKMVKKEEREKKEQIICFDEIFRQETWEKYELAQSYFTFLKALMQNPMPITDKELDNHVDVCCQLMAHLRDIEVDILTYAIEKRGEIENG